MAWLKLGKMVRVRCNAQPGPLGDNLITIDSKPFILSGFVKKDLVEKQGHHCYLRGKITGMTPEAVNVHLPGSFFTAASGTASLTREWAEENLEPA